MANPQDIIVLANQTLTAHPHGLQLALYRVNEMYAIAQALLIAYGPLQNHAHLVRGECRAGCDLCEALARIRSLPSA